MQNGVQERKLDLYGRRAIYQSFTIAVIRAVYILCTLKTTFNARQYASLHFTSDRWPLHVLHRLTLTSFGSALYSSRGISH